MRGLAMIFAAGMLLTGCVVEPGYGYGHHHATYYRPAPTYNVVVREDYRRPAYSHHHSNGYRGRGWGY